MMQNIDDLNGGTEQGLIILMVGNVGCGKSTLVSALTKDRKDVFVVSRDDVVTMISGGHYGNYDLNKKDLYFEIEKKIISHALNCGHSVIVDRTSMTVASRAKYLSMGTACSSSACYDFGPGCEESAARRGQEGRGYSPQHWLKVSDEIAATYEKPSYSEGFSHIIDMNKVA